MWVRGCVGMSVVKHFRELRVYREAFESAMRVFEATEGLTYPRTHTPTNMGRTIHSPQMLDEVLITTTTGAAFLVAVADARVRAPLPLFCCPPWFILLFEPSSLCG